ncbi:unnamed protein product [Pleuronectes platessa]|uniref:Uncharacterized protein n=1 Tax=Pleuronectes platessa TaxID=8262 RepID=A0A9N7VR14_PLEPL|nr:unnamed protein product [Pleuronectes platessa]
MAQKLIAKNKQRRDLRVQVPQVARLDKSLFPIDEPGRRDSVVHGIRQVFASGVQGLLTGGEAECSPEGQRRINADRRAPARCAKVRRWRDLCLERVRPTRSREEQNKKRKKKQISDIAADGNFLKTKTRCDFVLRVPQISLGSGFPSTLGLHTSQHPLPVAGDRVLDTGEGAHRARLSGGRRPRALTL